MDSLKFYNLFIVNQFFISNFNVLTIKDIPKIENMKLSLSFLNLTKINYITSVLSFSILTKTKPNTLRGLKNFKENKSDIIGLHFTINKNKFCFLEELIFKYLLDNNDSLIRLKSQPLYINNLSFCKFFEGIYVNKIYELNYIIRNSQQLKFKIVLSTDKLSPLMNSFFFNILIHQDVLPKPL